MDRLERENMDEKLLQVGDVIYRSSSYGGVNCKYTVKRVTKTQAVCGNTKFRRLVHGTGWVDITPMPTGYSSNSYRIATPELQEKFEFNKMYQFMEGVKWKLLDHDDLKKVYSLYCNLCV